MTFSSLLVSMDLFIYVQNQKVAQVEEIYLLLTISLILHLVLYASFLYQFVCLHHLLDYVKFFFIFSLYRLLPTVIFQLASSNHNPLNLNNIRNNSQIQLIMKSTTIVNQVLGSIIKEGKNILHDNAVTREKLPTYSNSKTQALNYGLIMHEGYGAQTIKRNNYLSLKKDELPQHIRKDQFCCKTIDVVRIVKQRDQHLDHIIDSNNSLYHLKNKKSIKKKEKFKRDNVQQMRQKQNTLLKLTNERADKMISRIKQRQQHQEESMRQSKRQSLIREYEEKNILLANKTQKDEKNGKMKQLLQCHTQKGQNHKFTFDISGDLLIFKEETDKIIKKNHPLQPTYRLQNDDIDNDQIKIKLNQGRYQKKGYSQRNNQNHKIKTARGLAFASSVMKTLNLSRISMNGTINTDQQQFMKRNDLFNNNHSRQTTNMPYFQLKNGTVYTQLTTNQVLSNQTDKKQVNSSFPESSANSQNTIIKKNQYDSQKRSCTKTAVKSMRSFYQKQDSCISANHNMIEKKQKICQQNLKILSSFKNRPQTCRIGQIITVNKQLAMSMIE